MPICAWRTCVTAWIGTCCTFAARCSPRFARCGAPAPWGSRARRVTCPTTAPSRALSPEEYTQWVGWYYNNICTYPWVEDIQPGDFVVIDQSDTNVGLCGSNNTLDCMRRGARGLISNGGVRDTDEVILQKIPFWSRYCSQAMVQGRLQFDARNIPIQVGGAAVFPGDVVVADGDGVVVVPRDVAREVALYAHQELRNDKEARRKKYETLGMDLDDTVR